MKKITLLLFAITLVIAIACSKSSPEPSKIYTVKYSIISTDTVVMDTIQYKDYKGEIITLLGQNELDYSFTSADNYDASLYLSGNIIIKGSVSLSLEVFTGSTEVYFDSYQESWDGGDTLPVKYLSSHKYTLSK